MKEVPEVFAVNVLNKTDIETAIQSQCSCKNAKEAFLASRPADDQAGECAVRSSIVIYAYNTIELWFLQILSHF